MRKLLFLILISLSLYTISSNYKDMRTNQGEWNLHSFPVEGQEQTCKTVKECSTLLKKYGVYDDVIDLLSKGLKAAAQKVCEKKLPGKICSDAITILYRYISQLN